METFATFGKKCWKISENWTEIGGKFFGDNLKSSFYKSFSQLYFWLHSDVLETAFSLFLLLESFGFF